MAQIAHVLHSVLPNSKIQHAIGDVKVHSLFITLAASTVHTLLVGNFNPSAPGIEALIKFKADSFFDTVMQVILSEGPKLNVAFVGEIDKLEFEVVPVVEGECIGVNLFIEGQPVQQAVMLELPRFFNPKLIEFSQVRILDFSIGPLPQPRLSDSGGEKDVLLLPDDIGDY
jgi:hypothetical protein